MQILYCLMLSLRSLQVSLLFKIIFFFWCSVLMSFIALYFSSFIHFSASPSLWLNLLVNFLLQLLYSSPLCLVLSYIFIVSKILTVFIHSSPKFSGHYDHIFTSLSEGFYLRFSNVFSEFFPPCILFGIYSSLSSFCLTLCLCLYILGKVATSPSHGAAVLYRRWFMGSRWFMGHPPHQHQSQALKEYPPPKWAVLI